MVIHKPASRLTLIAALSLIGGAAQAQLSFTGTALTENFDSLITTGTNQAWTNNTTLPGWNLFRRTSATDATPVANTDYNAGTGSSNTGSWYSFGTAGSSERSLGGLASGNATKWGSPATGAVAGWVAVAITNNTGATISDFTVGYDGEQWRDGGAPNPAAQTMVLEYGFGASFGAVTTWTAPGAGFNFASPVFTNTTTGAAVDGNGAGLVAGRGGTLTGQSWNVGDTLWFRWIENNDTGNDHGLSVDNFTFAALVAVPEPGTMALLGLIALPGIALLRRRK
jgi:hypothetical protein